MIRTLLKRGSFKTLQTSRYLVTNQASVLSKSLTLETGSVALNLANSEGGVIPFRLKGKLGRSD